MEYIKDYTVNIISGHIAIDSVDRFINQIQKFSSTDIIIQVFNAAMIFGKSHLFSAVHHTLRSAEQNRLITHSLSMELLLYASGERQLKHAIPKMGVIAGNNSIVILIIHPKKKNMDIVEIIKKKLISMYSFKEDLQVLKSNIESLHAFGITDEELQTIPKEKYHHLVLEKVAMVDIIK
ncbi:KEOPS complex subunit Cgi121 [Pseudomonadota bacterium]